MRYNPLGTSHLCVSELALGTMTFGQQNSLEESHQLLDYAFDHGINFFDTAEMYPVPAAAETQGRSEYYLGQWLANQSRDKVIIATKMVGPGRDLVWIRQGNHSIASPSIQSAINSSLERLQTDYIDLYQIHWPDRYVPLFGQTCFDPGLERETVPILEQLKAFKEVHKAGKFRYLGLSNETPWGVYLFSYYAKQFDLPMVVSIQNAYSLLNRTFETVLAETCFRENISLLAYSPLAFGILSGKYLDTMPSQSRLSLFQGYGGRYHKANVDQAVRSYTSIAVKYQISPALLALAFVRSRWFVSSTIIGATKLDQLQQNLECVDLDPEIIAEIDEVHGQYPNPAP